MDQFGAQNIRIVLVSLIVFTAMALAALLGMIVRGDEPPGMLIGLVGTLLGAVTGSTVSLTAPKRVNPKTPETAPLPPVSAGEWPAPLPTATPALDEPGDPDDGGYWEDDVTTTDTAGKHLGIPNYQQT